MISPVRILAGIVGGAMTFYGVVRLLGLGWANTWDTLQWLVGGVVLHDAVFAGLTLTVGLLAVRVVPRDRLAPWVVAGVVLVPTTLLAVPELGRFGARADNPTLLDRHYWLGWFVLVTLVLAAAVAAILVTSYAARVRRRPVGRTAGGDDGQGAGGR